MLKWQDWTLVSRDVHLGDKTKAGKERSQDNGYSRGGAVIPVGRNDGFLGKWQCYFLTWS